MGNSVAPSCCTEADLQPRTSGHNLEPSVPILDDSAILPLPEYFGTKTTLEKKQDVETISEVPTTVPASSASDPLSQATETEGNRTSDLKESEGEAPVPGDEKLKAERPGLKEAPASLEPLEAERGSKESAGSASRRRCSAICTEGQAEAAKKKAEEDALNEAQEAKNKAEEERKAKELAEAKRKVLVEKKKHAEELKVAKELLVNPGENLCKLTKENKANLIKLMLENRANPGARDDKGCFALLEACRTGSLEVTKLLVEAKTDVNLVGALTDGDTTAMHVAAKFNHMDIMKLLLDERGDTNLTNRNKETPLQVAKTFKKNEMFQFLQAHLRQQHQQEKDEKSIEELLAQPGALVKLTKDGKVKMVQAMLKAGADAGSCDKRGCFALLEACKIGSLEAAKLLVEAKTDVNRLGCFTTGDTSALHIAAKFNNMEVMKYLLDQRGDLNLCNWRKQKPIQVAEKFQKQEMVDFLHSFA